MKASGQFYSPAAFTPGKMLHRTKCIGGYMGLRTDTEAMEWTKDVALPRIESRPFCPQPIIIKSELSRILGWLWYIT
jgi:hypothetical protein